MCMLVYVLYICFSRITNKCICRCCCICVQDPTNLQGKLQKHDNFAAELTANQARIETVTKTGEELIAQDHYNKDHIRYVGTW